ncbi:hypothetical protein AB0D46_03860 [Streptomyces sp. NPDC048383]
MALTAFDAAPRRWSAGECGAEARQDPAAVAGRAFAMMAPALDVRTN